MEKLSFKRADPKIESDFLEIEMNWFDVNPGKLPEIGRGPYDELCQWAVQNCYGRWFWFLHYKNRQTNSGGNRICFSDPSDRIKFILKFM